MKKGELLDVVKNSFNLLTIVLLHFRSESESEEEIDDPRLRRLRALQSEDLEDRMERRRRLVHKPERVESSSSSSESSEDEGQAASRQREDPENEHQRTRRISICSESESDSDKSDDEIERRRQTIKQKMLLQKQQEEEILQKEEEKHSASSEEESSEYEDNDSEEDDEPRIKPQFVRKRDRTTIIEKEKDLIKQKQFEVEAKKQAKERRRYTLKLVEDSIKKDLEAQKAEKDPHINDVQTDDENDELEYEGWKLRELKRIKRERDERDQLEKEKQDIDKLRNMTEEERRKELQVNPKQVTNKGVKGKYKFLQKYYHRGAFYLDKEENVFKQDFAAPTLEDHFDKTILPKVMQVKNFGRCGRTKYTHLVDQDTTKFDSPWASETATNVKFVQEKAGGMKQNFDKPSYKRKKE
jgi:microfibrillar-associated protein 1